MRLKSIKLAGFKSFVDPTTVPFPTNLTAVVGPNGCGKSNIIDAVRWVMGESSAKNLRGESMTDVIFNGATTRKPVGQASIELIFDNTEGKLAGEYARFSEISIRRKVTRDATSDYYLNGTKCRRRDITDIFLGTGLGPRSYAIIEQGMISKLIESKPEELRIFIEEAAGISKYKERRKETESRLKRTLENLERLTDIRDELERQLQHLYRQAQSAEKYTELKAEERLKKAQISALRWLEIDALVQEKQGNISEAELELERSVTERVSHESRIEELRLSHTAKNDEFNQIQASFYAAGAEIAKLEQSIRHQKDRLLQLQKDKHETNAQVDDLNREIAAEAHRYEEVSTALEELSPVLEEQSAISEEVAIELLSQEESMHGWQNRWDEFNLNSAESRKKAEVEQSRIQQFEANIRKTEEQMARLSDERQLLEAQVSVEEVEAGQEQILMLDAQEETLLIEKEEVLSAIFEKRDRFEKDEQEVASLRAESQTLQGTIASLSALQMSAMGNERADFDALLKANGLESAARVVELLSVSEGWEQAAESALRFYLKGFSVPSLSLHAEGRQGSSSGLTLVSGSGAHIHYQRKTPAISLADVISPASGLAGVASRILLASTLSEALAMQAGLDETQSVVCKDGTLLGDCWISFPDTEDPASGALHRQRELDRYAQRLEDVMQCLEQSMAAMNASKNAIADLEQQRETVTHNLASLQKDKSSISNRLTAIEARQEQIRSRIRDISAAREDADLQLEHEKNQLTDSRFLWQEALEEVEVFSEQKEQMLQERDQLRERLDNLRQKARHDKDRVHQLQLQLQSLEAEKNALGKNAEKADVQLQRLQDKLEDLALAQAEVDHPLEDMRIALEEALEKRVKEEELLLLARQTLEQVDADLRADENNRQNIEQRVQTLRNVLQDIRMESQALEIKRNGLRDQLKEENYELTSVLEALPAGATLPDWEEEVTKIAARVQRLGAINLAAIEEYKIQKERKEYLDEQNNDLVEAIATLEGAIRKIDKETRAKFKETYDKVNGGLQTLFPKVFGGGSAYLELTGDDLLETGVAIMARPPGKKNSTIHLLSGGEKALTAIALVFSIFQLNPAPFCMLDEVDAPLDDANVGRYAKMVKEMSEQVQFIFISHNKIAMEMADQLMGVTMHEPGVSRLVSVDVEEAAALAAM
jgi:chromosome segregation protein